MTISLQDRVYFGAVWYQFDKEQPDAALPLGGRFGATSIHRTVTGNFFAGVSEKTNGRGVVTDVILSFAGVQTGTADGALLVAGIPALTAARAVALYEALLDDPRYVDAAIHVTGHSLGAGLTQYLAAYALATYGAEATDARADFAAFGSPSWSGAVATHFGLGADALDGRYTGYTAANDPVLLNGIDPAGVQVLLPAYDQLLPGLNEVRSHFSYTYMEALGLPAWLDAAAQQVVIDGIAGASLDTYDTAAVPGEAPLNILGDSAANRLAGMAGEDVLHGGAGRDIMTGGDDADTFRFTAIGETGSTRATADRITDFHAGDRIDLSAINARTGGVLGGVVDDAFAFIGAARFSGTAGELRVAHDGGTTFVSGDIDGDRVADFVLRLDGAHPLAATDFLL